MIKIQLLASTLCTGLILVGGVYLSFPTKPSGGNPAGASIQEPHAQGG